jgi:hypothetical protein
MMFTWNRWFKPLAVFAMHPATGIGHRAPLLCAWH